MARVLSRPIWPFLWPGRVKIPSLSTPICAGQDSMINLASLLKQWASAMPSWHLACRPTLMRLLTSPTRCHQVYPTLPGHHLLIPLSTLQIESVHPMEVDMQSQSDVSDKNTVKTTSVYLQPETQTLTERLDGRKSG